MGGWASSSQGGFVLSRCDATSRWFLEPPVLLACSLSNRSGSPLDHKYANTRPNRSCTIQGHVQRPCPSAASFLSELVPSRWVGVPSLLAFYTASFHCFVLFCFSASFFSVIVQLPAPTSLTHKIHPFHRC